MKLYKVEVTKLPLVIKNIVSYSYLSDEFKDNINDNLMEYLYARGCIYYDSNIINAILIVDINHSFKDNKFIKLVEYIKTEERARKLNTLL